MIIRVLGEGQYEVDESELAALEKLDADLDVALGRNDAAAFSSSLGKLLAIVRRGAPIPADRIVTSDLVLPGEHFDLDEVRDLLESEEEMA